MTMFDESRIFKNEDALSTEYLPEFLPHRETQIEEIARNLNPASRGRKPQNMFIFGPPGIGKTHSAKFVFRRFEEFSERVKTIYINTWDYNTSTSLLTKIVHGMDYFIPRRGVSKDEVLEKLIEALKRTKKSIIVCLDEVDQLIKRDENALYDLLRLNQYVDNPIGIVMISNYKDVFVDIEPRIRSSLDIEEIVFKPYTLQEMKKILSERAKTAFRVGVLEEGVILLSANRAIRMGGDVRIGLECLRKTARKCENENSDKITVKHMKDILTSVGPVKLNIMMDSLRGVDNNIIQLLKDKKFMLSTQLHQEYVKSFEEISQTALREHIKHLEDINIVRVKKRVKGEKGRRYYISLVKQKVFK